MSSSDAARKFHPSSALTFILLTLPNSGDASVSVNMYLIPEHKLLGAQKFFLLRAKHDSAAMDIVKFMTSSNRDEPLMVPYDAEPEWHGCLVPYRLSGRYVVDGPSQYVHISHTITFP